MYSSQTIHKRDVFALQLVVNRPPVGLGAKPMAALTPPTGIKRRLQLGLAQPLSDRPRQAGRRQPLQRLPDRGGRNAKTPRDLPRRNPGPAAAAIASTRRSPSTCRPATAVTPAGRSSASGGRPQDRQGDRGAVRADPGVPAPSRAGLSRLPRHRPSRRSYGAARVEAAAEHAIEIGARTYGSVKSILDNKLDRKRKHVTLQIVWDEYIAAHPGGYSYSRSCELASTLNSPSFAVRARASPTSSCGW